MLQARKRKDQCSQSIIKLAEKTASNLKNWPPFSTKMKPFLKFREFFRALKLAFLISNNRKNGQNRCRILPDGFDELGGCFWWVVDRSPSRNKSSKNHICFVYSIEYSAMFCGCCLEPMNPECWYTLMPLWQLSHFMMGELLLWCISCWI